jgi:hypothetical protein
MGDSKDTSFVEEDSGFGNGKVSAFSTTHWSVVLGAGQDNLAQVPRRIEKNPQSGGFAIFVWLHCPRWHRGEKSEQTQLFEDCVKFFGNLCHQWLN